MRATFVIRVGAALFVFSWAMLAIGAQTARTTLYASSIADKSDWEQESGALGPADSDGQDRRYAQIVRGITSSQELAISGWRDSDGNSFSFDEAAWRITAIYVNVKCRFDTGSSGNSVRLRSYDTGSGATSNSPTWSQSSSDDAMKWRYSDDGWNVVGQRGEWTGLDVRDLDIAVRRQSGSTQLRVDAVRLIVERTLIDADGDGVADAYDNCRGTFNPDQADSDGDGVGNACDNCPVTFNPDQADSDDSGYGDACGGRDGDFVRDAVDNCPFIFNPDQVDSDVDSVGDVCDSCPNAENRRTDYNSNGVDSACDAEESVVIDPKGAPNRPGNYIPGYADGTYGYSYGQGEIGGVGGGYVVAFGRRANGGGSTGGGFGAVKTHFDFDGESTTPTIVGTLQTERPTYLFPLTAWAFNGLWMNFTVVRPMYYRYTREGEGGELYRPAGSEADSKRLVPGEYTIYIGGTMTLTHWVFGSCRLELLNADPCPADINADGQVDDSDFTRFVAAYGELIVPDADPLADFNGDQRVDDADFVVFLGAYDQIMCP